MTGPLGIGKTRLVEAVLAEAEELGFHTLRGAAREEEGRTPYAPLVEALDPLAERRPELVGALTDSAQAALARLLPSVRRPNGVAEEPVDRHRVFSAVAQLLAQAASERGVVVAIDDLHAGDEATAALVHHLARSAAGERLLVVAGMRDEPLPEVAALVRSSLVERGAAVEVALGPLDRAALAAVAGRAAARPLCKALSPFSSARRRATRFSLRSSRHRSTPLERSRCRRGCARSSLGGSSGSSRSASGCLPRSPRSTTASPARSSRR